MQVDVLNSDGLAIEKSEMSLTELPPIPDWFQKQIDELAGFSGTARNVRVVSGLDPTIMEYYAGGWHRKYIIRQTQTFEYSVLHTPSGQKRILTPAEAKAVTPKMGILLPVVDKQTKEFGIPRYFVEIYKPPTAYGSEEAWQAVRFLEADDPTNLEGKRLDLLGEFPKNGGYDTWFAIEEPVIENGVAVRTKYKTLDEGVLEFIKYKIKEAQEKSMADQHLDLIEKSQEQLKRRMKENKDTVREMVKDNIDRIYETPKVVVPSNYDSSKNAKH